MESAETDEEDRKLETERGDPGARSASRSVWMVSGCCDGIGGGADGGMPSSLRTNHQPQSAAKERGRARETEGDALCECGCTHPRGFGAAEAGGAGSVSHPCSFCEAEPRAGAPSRARAGVDTRSAAARRQGSRQSWGPPWGLHYECSAFTDDERTRQK